MQLHAGRRQIGPNQRIPSPIPRQETPVTTPTKISTKPHATSHQSQAWKHMAIKKDMGTTQVQTLYDRKNKPRAEDRKITTITINKLCIPLH